jgi:hypothetical protein
MHADVWNVRAIYLYRGAPPISTSSPKSAQSYDAQPMGDNSALQFPEPPSWGLMQTLYLHDPPMSPIETPVRFSSTSLLKGGDCVRISILEICSVEFWMCESSEQSANL